MNHHQIQSCLSFWNDVGIISYINDSQQRGTLSNAAPLWSSRVLASSRWAIDKTVHTGWYHRGESTSLSSWVFLDRNWPAHLYLRLCQNAREFLPKVRTLPTAFDAHSIGFG
jgi:hypothetical protein